MRSRGGASASAARESASATRSSTDRAASRSCSTIPPATRSSSSSQRTETFGLSTVEARAQDGADQEAGDQELSPGRSASASVPAVEAMAREELAAARARE